MLYYIYIYIYIHTCIIGLRARAWPPDGGRAVSTWARPWRRALQEALEAA